MTPDRWNHVKSLLHAAMALEPHARAGYLASACGGDDDLRQDVESLLLASERAETFMETPAAVLARSDTFARRVPRIGPYRIVREIGRGGMAAVYLAARDDGEYRKEVAIKVVLHSFMSEFILGRFRQERQILADLEHPHVARLLDGGTTEDGLPYLVLEHIAGSPIDAYCDQRRLPIAERLRLFLDVCAAVGYAHQRLIVHRDLKPSNILVTEDGTPKLLDFGIAKLLGDGDRPGNRTVTGWRLMTPEYASPEQVRGEDVGVPTDIYALGVVLYRLVTGQNPFRANNDTPHTLARAICEDEPELPSVVLRRANSPPVSRDLDAIVMKALSKDPQARYLSAGNFADDVRRYLDKLPIAARRPMRSRHLCRIVSRHRAASIALAGLLVAAAGLAIALRSRGEARAHPSDVPPMSVGTLTTLTGTVSGPTFSSDGKFIAFSWSGDATGKPGIYTVPVAGGTPVRVTSGLGTEEWPAWSPDGSQITFVRQMPAASGIFSVPAGGGPERKLLGLRDDRYYWLAWSPDGRYLAFADRPTNHEPHVLSLLSLDTLARRRLASSRSAGGVLRFGFSPDGKSLAFIAADKDKVHVRLLSLSDESTRSVYSQKEWIGSLAWTADGRALALSLNQQGVRRLIRVPISGGKPEPLSVAGEDAYYPALSRSGNRLAFVREISDTDLWRVEVNAPRGRTSATPFVKSTRSDALPRFSPDGKKIAFLSSRSGSLEIWVADSDGGNQSQLTSFNGSITRSPDWSPDGRHIVVWAEALYVIPIDGGKSRRLDVGGRVGELASWSNDGQWIYFVPANDPDIWRIPAQGGQAVQVTKNGAAAHRESVDGKHLYYTKFDRPGIWRMPVSGGQETCVIEEFQSSLLDYWDLVDDGIYFVDPSTSPYPTMTFYKLATHRKSPLAMLAGPVNLWGGGLTVSPDRRSIVYTQSAYKRSEIVLIDNFR